jgi:hypothetical protein
MPPKEHAVSNPFNPEPLRVRVHLTLRRIILIVPTLWIGLPALLYLPVIAPSLGLSSDQIRDALPAVLAAIPFGMAGLAALSRVVLRTPVLELNDDGIRIRGPWPSPPHWDLTLAWEDLDHIHATSHYLYSRGWWRFDSLWFVPEPGVPVQLGWRDLALRVFDLSGAPKVNGLRVGVSNGWTHSVQEVVAYAQQHRPDLRFIDDRQDSPFGHYLRRDRQTRSQQH